MKKNRKFIIGLIVVLLTILILLLISSFYNSATPKYSYKCTLSEDNMEILEINDIKYAPVYDGEGSDLYDGKYSIDNKLYKRDKYYAAAKVNTECDDWPVYTLEGINPKKWVVKLAHDYTGMYDGQLFKSTNNTSK